MSLLKPSDRDALRTRFQQELRDEVYITLFTTSTGGLTVPGAECEYCPTTRQLLEEVTAVDSRLHLRVRSIITEAEAAGAAGVDRVPAILIGAAEEGARVRFYGIPAGFEFGLLVEDLIAASRPDGVLSNASRDVLGRLTRDVHIKVLVTPTCPYCPRAGRLAHAMALASSRVRADVIEAMEFPALAERYGVSGVPKVVINETKGFEGALPEPALLAAVAEAGGATLVPETAEVQGGTSL